MNLFNSTIFNEAQNMNDHIEALTSKVNDSADEDVARDAQDRLDAYTKLIIDYEYNDAKENSPKALKKAMKNNGNDKREALADVIGIDPVDDFLEESGEQLWFVPADSLLYSSLGKYFQYVTGNNNFQANARKFIRGYHDSPDKNDNILPTGFFWTSGSGYEVFDDLLRGTVSAGKNNETGTASGEPVRRFIEWLNNPAAQLGTDSMAVGDALDNYVNDENFSDLSKYERVGFYRETKALGYDYSLDDLGLTKEDLYNY